MKNLGVRVAIVFMTTIAISVGIILILLMNGTISLVSDMLVKQSQTANKAFANTFSDYQSVALERAEMIAGSGDIIDSILNGDSDALLRSLKNYSVGLDLITLCDANGIVLARTHNDKTGDSVASQKAISTALSTGKGISTIEPGTVIGMSTRGSAAIKDYDGNIIGALTCGHDLSLTKYVDAIKQQNDCEASFFAGDVRMSTTLLGTNGNRVVGEKASQQVIETVIQNKRDYRGRLELYGVMYEAHYSPVIVENQVIGMIFTGVNVVDTLKNEQGMIVLIVIAMILLLSVVLLTAFIIRWITNKSYWYESMLDSIPFPVSVTDMNMKWTFINKSVEDMLNVKRKDVLGKHCSNWGAAICNTSSCGIKCLNEGKQKTLFEQNGMNFSVDVNFLHNRNGRKSGHIEVVQDISEMVKAMQTQTQLVNKIGESSHAFVSGSRQISNGAQSLAQGSTEQAAAVQQLSTSIAEIAQKTKENSDKADSAASLANSIKLSAQKGTQQMDEMMSAVTEIEQASQSIGKVIKVIDDIAFQTNILALNAAVEAARAGQHGKGFAVVAEEVRNLASKSAEAAKDTGDLIANSIKKSELGSQIAKDTAASLSEIVEGINESNRIVNDIARSSQEQSSGIEQINKGIDQVAQVVQQNSATAQQSAATSQELSERAEMLMSLVSEFTNSENANSILLGEKDSIDTHSAKAIEARSIG